MVNSTNNMENPSYFRRATNGIMGKRNGTAKKPLPLKQRTSSADPRRDFSTQTWTSLLGIVKAREFVVTVDHFSIWRRHLAWSMDGEDLREYMTKRYASSMVFMSLLLGTELAVLFNSAGVTTRVRKALEDQEQHTISFWIGILIILSAVLTLLSLISTFTAWSMVSAIHKENAKCVLRSSIGQYAAELPGRFIVSSIYVFLLWVILFFFLLLPVGAYSVVLLIFAIGLFVHTITAFSSFGRIIMHSGAMGNERVFDLDYETTLTPHSLHQKLLGKARALLDGNISVRRQYQDKKLFSPIRNSSSVDELSTRLSERSGSSLANRASPTPELWDEGSAASSLMLPNYQQRQPRFASPGDRSENSSPAATATTVPTNNCNNEVSPSPPPAPGGRARSNSLVKFSDGFDTAGRRVEFGEGQHKRGNSNGGSPTIGVLKSAKRTSAATAEASPEDEADQRSSSKPSPLKSRSTSSSGRAVVQTETGAAEAAASAWIQNQQNPYQQMMPSPVPQYHHARLTASPPNGMAARSQGEASPSTRGKWLASGSAPFYGQQSHMPLAPSPPGASSTHISAPPANYGYGHFQQQQYPLPMQQQPPGNNGYPGQREHGAPTAVGFDSRGTSFGSIPSQIGGGRSQSLASDLDSFANFQGEREFDEEDNVASYDDKDIDELLDAPSNPNSANSVQTISTKSTEEKQSGSLLAGLAIEVCDDYEDEQFEEGETGALLRHAEHGQYQSCEKD